MDAPLEPAPHQRGASSERGGPKRRREALCSLLALAGLALCGCSGDDGRNGSQGEQGAPGDIPAPSRALSERDPAPGVVARIVSVSGGSLAGGQFRAGDHITVRFELEQNDGTPWDIAEMNTARALVSGPTFNYQPVIAQATDLASAATHNADGSWSYTFATAIPTTYLAPQNDSPDLGPESGELTGEALLDGTYTVGMYFGWNYTINGLSARDAGDATFDFLYGASSTLEPRSVVTTQSCNQCHDSLRFHGGLRRATTLCLLCHTAGAEDRPSTANPTPGATIDFDVMIHRIHNAPHLPSANGVTTDPMTGERDYTATPVPYVIAGTDFSEVEFPAWPNFDEPMPRDLGYTALGSAEKAQDDNVRRGVTSCSMCHGDPDGPGPLEAPTNGDLVYSQPSRSSCRACHDDWDPAHDYVANGQLMEPQADDASCRVCHTVSGSSLSVMDAHLHPLLDPNHARGANLELVSVNEAGTNDGDDRIDIGEKLTVTFFLRDNDNNEVDPADISQLFATVLGPTANMQLLEYAQIPTAMLTGAQPYTIPIPSRRHLELVGTDAGGLQTFTTAATPHINLSGATTDVFVVDSMGAGMSTLTAAIVPPVNYIDVVNGAAFARNDYIVIDSAALDAEYLRIQTVEGNRLWFSSPYTGAYPTGPAIARALGTSVQTVNVSTRAAGTDYSLDALTGDITELVDFGNGGPVLVSYSTEFVMPAVYPVTLNGGPDLGEAEGGWTGKPVIDGTYRLTLWGRRDLNVSLEGETNSYRERFEGEAIEFLGGDATVLEPYAPLTSRDNCYSCHVAITFHGRGRIGVDTCIACHGAAATGDRPQYVAPGAAATDGLTINFRSLIHKVHMGAELENGSSFVVNGFGSGAYPNNFGSVTFDHIHFPAMPDGVKSCTTCHGEGSDAFKAPNTTDHPTVQVTPGQPWSLVCGSCHDGAAPQAHIAAQTSPSGAESCAICHGVGEDWNVELMHMRR
ncbi:MAG: hypothetical protein R3F49_23830 [Planctomycetota bacterium]